MLLTDAQIEERLRESHWGREGDAIVRDWRFANFERAMVFVNLVADAAEAANHHPDILVHG
ncbi:MAG: 4a-hydroxytetrahydrobiopterin dehydratase, partial [Solirubrobacteraceae bacterium]|nr:4a-hydroxytetrahydrobiopterin dehydratase [Solirubrobacteraceae bacterium]